ncbi:MAG: biotin/lipoyl-binding protein [Gammaproteobacteria bacterium]|nr:biotin/lipoyl-binding protein [Gammaproteobacteria bacterium]
MADVKIEPITRLLIANRGEIARRILRTAHDMGIDTVAVYADGDANAPFVKEAGSAIALNGRTARQTYLDVDKVIGACRRSGADAVHPGYGFLSENQAFAQAVIDAGLKWLGPAPEVIGLMGDKLSAKALMQEAGVPTLNAIEITDATEPAEAARQIGYPVLVKAAAGGGGRGMRVVEDESGLEAAIAGARRESGAAFGDDTLFLEKWLDHARHVEMQILGDRHGNLVHCFERECSIQRRHQKVIEEAPSPAVTPGLRQRLGEAAIAAARKLGYSSAGTVEFLVQDDDFFFLEVNARLQVEHPVTEEIIGHDLVREQVRIAEGEPLSFTQDDLAINGWAIEARLYAENPERNFLPAPGTVAVWRPAEAGQARYDSGVESGSEISIEFDPMIAKVTAHGLTRREAAGRLARALEATEIHGLTTNRDFLVATLRTPEFLAGDTTTDFIERVNPPRRRAISGTERIEAAVAAALEGQARRRARARISRRVPSGWRNSTMPWQKLAFDIGGETLNLEYQSRRDGKFRMIADGGDEMLVEAHACGSGRVEVAIDGKRLRFRVQPQGDDWFVQGRSAGLTVTQLPRYPDPAGEDQGGGLAAPMPGAVLSTAVAAGDAVQKGQLLLILEAMKMEHRITAPRDGTIEALHVTAGDQVENGQLLVTIRAEETP